MNESGDQQQQRAGSSVNPKIASDSGYGSNKSTQRSSGSSKSHESSVSSESSTAYPPHPDAPVSIPECQSHPAQSPSQGGGTKRQGKKKSKSSDRKPSLSEKPEGTLPQSMDQSGSSNVGTSNLPSGAHSQQQSSQIMSPGSKTSSTHDSKALQMAALTHALSCMKKFHKPLTASEIHEENEEMGTTSGKNWQEYFANDIKVDDSGNEDTFASVVSLEDGIIVYITPSISSILGFPKDMLVGRSFIDFVHPKDRMAFASHITCGMSFPMGEQHNPQNQQQGTTSTPTGPARVKSEPFYCRLRQYRGLKTVGFGVVDKTVLYCPFKLSMTLKKVEQPQKQEVGGGGAHSNGSKRGGGGESQKDGSRNEEDNKAACPTSVHLVILANRIKSAYQYSDEIPSNPGKFVTRHSASCHFGHMDSEAISYLGHLPQDLIGNSVLDYYHPEDMALMKDIYEGVMQEQGKPFRSKPYRFRVYNGTFAMLETDWSCFINPWSWKLEFVIGQHRVIKGPGNPNVFMQPTDDKDTGKSTEPEEILGEGKELQNEIKRLLTETVTRRLSDPLRQQSSRRRKGLAALMESLLEGMAKPENSDKSGSQCSGMFSVMERDSVMLGEISPHHDDQSGSNQSSETPPSYNQLNYRENIERFFQSQPKTVRSDESTEMDTSTKQQKSNPSANRSSDSDSKSSPNIDYSSGSNTNARLSSGSVSNENESGNMTCASPLTEERLSRHNEAMEKYMIQRHRELRGKSSMTPGSHKESRHKHSEKVYFPVASSTSLSNDNDKCSYYIKLARCQRRTKCKHNRATAEISHGLKRTGNASWDGDNTHTPKQPHLECLPGRNPTLPPGVAAPPGVCCAGHGHNSINLWPPFSIAMTPGITTSTYRSAGVTGTGASYPTAFPGVPPCFNPNPPVRGEHAAASGKLVPDTISMSATTPSAPLLFLPSHPHPHQQFVAAQQVQLFPAGVVYQPLGSCIYGQPSPIMMPARFLQIHPDQSTGLINQMESSSQPTVTASQGEAIGTATLPKLPEKNRHGLSSPRCSYNMKTNTNCKQGFSPRGAPVTAIPGPSRNMGVGGNGRSMNLGAINLPPSASSCLLNSNMNIGNEGSGSDESMNSSFMNTEDKEASQSNSDADQDVQLWGTQRQEGLQPSGGTNNNASGTPRPVRNKQPPWLEKVNMTPDLMYRYRIPAGDLSDVLRKDLEALKIFGKQSTMVNDQLGMLYSELKLEGNSGMALNLEEGTTSNSSSGDENSSKEARPEPRKTRKPVASHLYSKMVILYEENAPFPPDSKSSPPKSEAEV